MSRATGKNLDPRLRYEAYRDSSWAPDLFREDSAVPHERVPFYHWRPGRFEGRQVNVDARGFRATWNPPVQPGAPVDTLWTFGGSALWGDGARDHGTISSAIARRLFAVGRPAVVVNAGARGYTFTQCVVRLETLLLGGYRPRQVLFYNGANEVFYSAIENRPGALFGGPFPRGSEEKLGPGRLIANQVLLLCRENLLTVQVITILLNRGLRTDQQVTDDFPNLDPGLASGIVAEYASSLALLDHLATAYGFRYLCFWQPVAYLEPRLLPEEAAQLGWNRTGPPYTLSGLERLYREVDEETRRITDPRFRNIKDAFRDRTRPYYVDVVHVTEAANESVARRIIEEISKIQPSFWMPDEP